MSTSPSLRPGQTADGAYIMPNHRTRRPASNPSLFIHPIVQNTSPHSRVVEWDVGPRILWILVALATLEGIYNQDTLVDLMNFTNLGLF